MALLEREFDDILSCSICLEFFKNPKILPCQHTFCHKPCLEKLFDIQRQEIRCPECRAQHHISDQGIKALPNNITITNFLDYRENKLRNKSTDYLCLECFKKTDIEKCVHCEKLLCEDCRKDHVLMLSKIIKRQLEKIAQNLPELKTVSEEIQKCVPKINRCREIVLKKVETVVEQCIQNVIEKGEYLKKNLDDYLSKELCKDKVLCNNLLLEYNIINDNCNLANKYVSETEQNGLLLCKKVFPTMINFLNNFEHDTNYCKDRIQFYNKSDSEICTKILSNFNEIKVLTTFSEIINQEFEMEACKRSNSHIFEGNAKIQTLTSNDPTSYQKEDFSKAEKFIRGPLSGVVSLSNLRKKDIVEKMSNCELNSNTTKEESIVLEHFVSSKQSSRKSNMYHKKGNILKGIELCGINKPRSLNIGVDDTIVATDVDSHSVFVFDKDGELIRNFGFHGPEKLKFPMDVAVNKKGRFIVSDTGNNRIQVFDRLGNFFCKFGSHGTADGFFNNPCGVTTDSSDLIYVCDRLNHRIQVFQPDGTFLRKFGNKGSKLGQFLRPLYIAISRTGRIFVSDSDNNRIQIFNLTGQILSTIGTKGSGDGQFKYPMGVAVDEEEHIIVADGDNSRIQIFYPDGRFLHKFNTFCHLGLQKFAVNSNGNIIISDWENKCITMF